MAYHAVLYTYDSDVETQDRIRPEHRAWLASLEDLVASGPLDSTPARALIIVKGDSPAALEALFDNDPFWKAGVIAGREILAWNPVIGVFAGED